MGIDQNPFPNAQVNMVNVNFPRPDQPRQRLDLCGSAKAAAERRAREIPEDPKARGKDKLYPEVAKVPEIKVSSKEEPPKALCYAVDANVRCEDIDLPDSSQNRSMWISVGEGKSRDMACVLRPRPADESGVPTFKVPNTKAGQWYRSICPKLPPVPLCKREGLKEYATTCKEKLEWANKRAAEDEKLYGDDEGNVDNEYIEELPE
ncbi:hypothetical protein L3X38_005342 [Prunus dulcis]|uniref:Uncharacterized protein n=1 Tax=Prunus dulcis TaxID=3755 RepID=A0AAD4ZQP7_PRUDU|nr:hypothetical protein L3X38_005342 [Prunus dulcis]